MRYVSFTFDDGSITCAKKIHQLLHPYHATFYVVTGWLSPTTIKITDRFNIDVDHGTLDQWKEVSELGHDVGSHTHTHMKANDIEIEKDCIQSLEVIKQIHEAPYNISSPHFTDLKVKMFDSIRLGTYETMHKSFVFEKYFNKLNNIDFLSLYCCDLYPDKVLQILEKMPHNSWLILAYHSLDGEGFCPVESNQITILKNALRKEKIDIVCVSEMQKKMECSICN